jgi:hypothetical protein
MMWYLFSQMRTSLLATTFIVSLGWFGASAGCKKKQETPESAVDPRASPPPVAVDIAPPPPPDAAAVVEDPLKTICPQVLAKIVDCSEDKEFEMALKEGTSAKDQKLITRLINGIAEWPSPACGSLAASYEHTGFLDRWKDLSDPAILESCAKLGSAVKAAGGLFGGDSDL